MEAGFTFKFTDISLYICLLYLSINLHYCNSCELILKPAEPGGGGGGGSLFWGLTLGLIGHRATAECISPATIPLRKETATFLGSPSNTGTLFMGN